MRKSTVFGIIGAVMLVAVAAYWLGGERNTPVNVTTLDTTTTTTYALVPSMPQPVVDIDEARAFARSWEARMGLNPGWYTDYEAAALYVDTNTHAEWWANQILSAGTCEAVRDAVYYARKEGEVWITFVLAWHHGYNDTTEQGWDRWNECSF